MILGLAIKKGHRNLVLGAWGCGAFGDDLAMVASCFKNALADAAVISKFDLVGFAIPCFRNNRNFCAFERCFTL